MSAPSVTPALHFGIATPQANPTVEAEFRHYFRGRLLPLATRLTSRAADPAERLREYFDQLGPAIESFDTLPLAAFGFACTGSGYLAGAEAEDASAQRLAAHFGLPVVTATAAIRAELTLRGARRLAIAAPYPEWLCAAARDYWQAAGWEVASLQRLETGSEDTRSIYRLTGPAVAEALAALGAVDADILLLSGTGMPSLSALLDHRGPTPMIASNLCLAAQLLRRTGEWPADRPADAAALIAEAGR